MMNIISNPYRKHKDIYLMDIGGGNFQMGHAMARYINGKDVQKDFTLHIFNLRGEGWNGEKQVTEGNCIIYNIGNCKIEELADQLKEFSLEGKVDCIVSSWCFRHLADPLGTFVQTYNFLRPYTGLLFMDWFFFLNEDQKLKFDVFTEANPFTQNMFSVLKYTKAPYVVQWWDCCRSLDRFVLRKPDNNPCRLPLAYKNTESLEDGYQVGSSTITVFKKLPTPNFQTKPPEEFDNQSYLGHPELWSYFVENELFTDSYLKRRQEK